MSKQQQKFNLKYHFLVLGGSFGKMSRCRTINDCDIVMFKKENLETDTYKLNKQLDNIISWLSEESPNDNWTYKISKIGNHNFWKRKEDIYSSGKKYYSKNQSMKAYDDYHQYDDGYVALCDEFSRDELDPDLAEAWDESYSKHYH